MSRFGPRKIVSELRRRRLFNTVALYIVGAWVALQVTELALPGMGIPDYAIRYVWIGAFVLFPLVLVFGWLYDISAAGIQRTPPTGEDGSADTSLRRFDHVIISILSSIALLVTVSAGVRIKQVEPDPMTSTVDNSIAVFPFAVCDDYARDRQVAGGLMFEVINRLAERGKLKVIAQTSTYTLAGVGMDKQEIARPLGVEYVLSGEVCREDGVLTISAQLADEDNFIVWADQFAQEVNEWDQITERLATLVADGVAAKLGDVMLAAPEAPVNVLAYEQLLIGSNHWDQDNNEQARAAFERALEYEPDYAEALYYLVLLDHIGFLSEGREESIAEARPIVEKALLMARRQLEQYDRSAYNHYMVARLLRVLAGWDEELAFRWNHASDLDTEEIDVLREHFKSAFAESERHFRTAVSLNPSLTNAYLWLADVIEKQGLERRTEALEILEDGQVRDPFNLYYNGRIAKRWAGRGRYRQAIELMERFKALPEIPTLAWWWQLELMQIQGYWDEKAETLVDMLQNDPGAFDDWFNRWQIWWFVSSLAYMGLQEEAEAWKVRLENMPMDDWMYQKGLHNYLWVTGKNPEYPADSAHWLIENGEFEQAIEKLETGRHERKMWHEREVQDDMTLISLYEVTGRDDAAQELLDSTISGLEAEYAMGIRHYETLYHLSEAYARNGQDEEAIDMLRKSYDYHGLIRCSEIEQLIDASPWIRLASEPGYISRCERVEADLNQQAEQVRALLARYDVDELLAPLTALVENSPGKD